MQIDFHYYTIRLITEKAGFSADEAQIIAFASQLVDDAVDYEKMHIKGNFFIDYPRYDGEYFDPICTAHKGLQHVHGLKTDIQKKIYIAFHFLPDIEFINQEPFDFITKPNGKIARDLVLIAITELSKSKDSDRIKNLIKLGIALHSFADTWAHNGFSGRHNSLDNDIEDLTVFKNNQWEKISIIKQTMLNALPDIGHSEANRLPDKSYLKWKYVHEHSKTVVERDNTSIFMEAAYQIFAILGGTNYLAHKWEEINFKLKDCFSLENDDLQEKVKIFHKKFPEIGFNYDENQWKKEALEFDKKTLQNVINPKTQKYIFKDDLKWFYFQIEALKHRNYVLERIPEQWS